MELPGQILDPFHSEAINEVLNPLGLAYSGGLGRSGKPHFFLAELLDRKELKRQTVLFSGKELARDLASPPAMSMGGVIHVRRLDQETFYGHILSGPNGALPSYVASPTGGRGVSIVVPQGAGNRRIKKNEPVLVDIVGAFQGYYTDASRTYAIGKLPDHLHAVSSGQPMVQRNHTLVHFVFPIHHKLLQVL